MKEPFEAWCQSHQAWNKALTGDWLHASGGLTFSSCCNQAKIDLHMLIRRDRYLGAVSSQVVWDNICEEKVGTKNLSLQKWTFWGSPAKLTWADMVGIRNSPLPNWTSSLGNNGLLGLYIWVSWDCQFETHLAVTPSPSEDPLAKTLDTRGSTQVDGLHFIVGDPAVIWTRLSAYLRRLPPATTGLFHPCTHRLGKLLALSAPVVDFHSTFLLTSLLSVSLLASSHLCESFNKLVHSWNIFCSSLPFMWSR